MCSLLNGAANCPFVLSCVLPCNVHVEVLRLCPVLTSCSMHPAIVLLCSENTTYLQLFRFLSSCFISWVWADGLRTCGGSSMPLHETATPSFTCWQRQVGSRKNRHGFALRPRLLGGGGWSWVPSGMHERGTGDPTIQLIFVLAQWGFLRGSNPRSTSTFI